MTEHFIDIAYKSVNKVNEVLCGDTVEVVRENDKTILVLADGLGSGVKANILSTMTCKIASTMLKEGESVLETIDTIMHTLPVCKVRNLAYSTFAIIDISNDGLCNIIEYDNPPVFILRNNHLLELKKETMIYEDKKVFLTSFQMELGDQLVVVSDGVIHAGVGGIMNLGWQWEHVADFLKKESRLYKSAERIATALLDACNILYDFKPGDDTTVASIILRAPETVDLFSGPPENSAGDADFVRQFVQSPGKKVVCGGTASNIVAKNLNTEVETSLDYLTPDIPPIGHIKGIDLVTEGVLTLSKSVELIRRYRHQEHINLNAQDGATRLSKLLIEDCTHINFWIGSAINPAHQNPDFPSTLSIKRSILNELIQLLQQLGKVIHIHYI
ncbi:MAG: SpoIIE family protein phosphatase [Clostridia bacterium]|nr:SpoIIE family protein phosphatase [Clostridia bacterium]